jgi:hypothetical protein
MVEDGWDVLDDRVKWSRLLGSVIVRAFRHFDPLGPGPGGPEKLL